MVVPKNTAKRGHAKFFKVTDSAKSAHASASTIVQASRNMMAELVLIQMG